MSAQHMRTLVSRVASTHAPPQDTPAPACPPTFPLPPAPISQAQPTRFRPGPVPEARVSTVTPGSIAVLQRAGAWEEAEAHSAAFDTMQVRQLYGCTTGPGERQMRSALHAMDGRRVT